MSASDWPVKRDAIYGCWFWQGRKDRNGYGLTKSGKMAYHVVHEGEVGPVPEGLVLDHLCKRPACCNPLHLEPVTKSDNEKRKSLKWRVRHVRACPRGHELKLPIMTPTGGRLCRVCAKENR